MHVALESPNQPAVIALINQLDDYQRPLYPAESFHGIDMEALCHPDVLFAVARNDAGDAVACGALVIGEQHAEVKRMFTLPSHRGQGLARSLLDVLEASARARGCARFVLETGYLQREAIALYERAGYRSTGPFGDYVDDPNSVFMAKPAQRSATESAGSLRTQHLLVDVALESPRQLDVVALIADLDAYQDTLYPAEARYALDLDALAQPDVLFAVARDADGVAWGCGAIVLNADYGELKRMYVRPEARGSSTARLVIDFLESAARARGCNTVLLETGPSSYQALAFYARQGYVRCGPYGEYPDHPLSVFMRKQLGS
jgi:putative acetyltransferase